MALRQYANGRAKLEDIEVLWQKKGLYTMTDHCHEEYEIVYLLEGERMYFVADQTVHIKKGDLLLVDSNALHRGIDAPGTFSYEKIQISFRPKFLHGAIGMLDGWDYRRPFRAGPCLHLQAPQSEELELILERLMYELTAKPHHFEAAARLVLLNLLLFADRLQAAAHKNTERDLKPDNKIIQYINANYTFSIKMEDIAKKFHFNPSYFSTKFKKDTGFSFSEYVNILRIREARKLLAETDQSISEISARIGYNNLTHFGRVFRSHTNCSPSEYRKRAAAGFPASTPVS